MRRAVIAVKPSAPTLSVPVAPPATRYALVMEDGLALRGGAKSGGTPLALLTQGELLELRGERMDYVQVWDLSRERGGFVRAHGVRPLALTPDEAPELLALVRFLRDRPGSESLGLGLVAAYLKAAPAGSITAEAFDAMGTMADRLAWRANVAAVNAANAPVRPGEPTIAAQLEVANGLGIHYATLERDGHVRLCYDGDAFRHVASLAPTPEQSARAALALTRHDCIADTTPPLQRWQIDQARAQVLARVPVADLPPYVRNRIRMRQAGVWSEIAFEDSRRLVVEAGATPSGLPAVSANDVIVAGNEALEALAGIDKAELADDDQSTWTDAAMRVGASRWAAEPVFAPAATGLRVATQPGQPGETCVLLLDAKHDANHPLARHCTFGTVWTASARANAASTALTLAVQPLAAWRELWMFRATARGLDAAGAAAGDGIRRPGLRGIRRLGAGDVRRARCARSARRAASEPLLAHLRAARRRHAGHAKDGRRARLAEGVLALPGSGVEAGDGQPAVTSEAIGVYFTSSPIA